MINDSKMVELINGYCETPVTYDCILYVTIEGGVKGIDPQLIGTAVEFKGDTYSAVEDTVSKAANVVGKVASVTGLLGGVADALDGAQEGLANDGAVLAFCENTVRLFVLDKMGNKIVASVYIPLSKVNRVRKSKMLLWHTVKFFFNGAREISLSITSKVVGVKNQKENVLRFVEILDGFVDR